MPLDPQVEAVLAQIDALGLASFTSVSPVEARRLFEAATPPGPRAEVTSVGGFNLRIDNNSFAPNNFHIDMGFVCSRMVVLSVAKGNFVPGSALTAEWKEIRRDAGDNVAAIEARERKIEIYGW